LALFDAHAKKLAVGDWSGSAVQGHPACAGTLTMTWEVTAVEAGTRVDSGAEDVPDGISAEDHAAGLASSLTNFATYLEQ
jgi:hypothetical protein